MMIMGKYLRIGRKVFGLEREREKKQEGEGEIERGRGMYRELELEDRRKDIAMLHEQLEKNEQDQASGRFVLSGSGLTFKEAQESLKNAERSLKELWERCDHMEQSFKAHCAKDQKKKAKKRRRKKRKSPIPSSEVATKS
jgi:4-diphosphocytidyl-2C-methyl-D-erythritol kinase